MTLILSGTNGLSDVDGSASTPAIRGTDSNTGIFFPAADTIAFAEGGAEVARFDSSGNFGLGVTPAAFGSDTVLAVYNASTPRIKLQNSTTGTANTDGAELNMSSSDFIVENREAGNIRLFNNGAERARIDSSGNLLVGTTSNSNNVKLRVNGGAQAGGEFERSVTTPAAHVYFRNPNGVVGQIETNGSTTTYATSSDYRLKENIAPMTGALARVATLKPVTYKWKTDGSDGQGFIAHELQAVMPDAVVGEKDAVDAEGNPVYQGIDTSFLVATLTAAIKEQQALIESLTARIAALEAA